MADLWGTRPVDLERQYKEKTMGRPINKRHFGALGSDTVSPNIPVEAAFINGKIARAEATGGAEVFIVKQKSSRRFLVQSVDDGEQAICKLVNKVTDSSAVAAGEMVIIGYYNGQAVNIQKMSNRVATDFSSNRYKWSVQDDSTTTILILSDM